MDMVNSNIEESTSDNTESIVWFNLGLCSNVNYENFTTCRSEIR